MKNGIIFDLDGTLWSTVSQVVPAWNRVFNRHSELNFQITDAIMKSLMGKTVPEIAATLFPNLSTKCRLSILKECCQEEQHYLNEYGGSLYPNLKDTLRTLHTTYSLFIVSNCQTGYIETFLNYHKLSCCFDDYECSGNTGKLKGENIRLIIDRNNLTHSVYIGDTQSDLDAADTADIPFIHAAYGFGTINRKEPSISAFSDLPYQIERIL